MPSRQFSLIPARVVVDNPARIPEIPAAYLVFFRHGSRLLRAAAYYEFGGKRPLIQHGHHHLYTGAAANLRKRLLIHLTSTPDSDLRQTLLAVEHGCCAISRSETPHCAITCGRDLSRWLAANAFIAFRKCDVYGQYIMERELLGRYASPLNIQTRKATQFAKRLLAWRIQRQAHREQIQTGTRPSRKR